MEQIVTPSKMESFRRNLPASLLKIKEANLAASNERLLLNGFPNSRIEAWKYSRLNRIASLNLQPKNSAPIGWEQYSLTTDAYTFVFQNDQCIYFSQDLPDGMMVKEAVDLSIEEWKWIVSLVAKRSSLDPTRSIDFLKHRDRASSHSSKSNRS